MLQNLNNSIANCLQKLIDQQSILVPKYSHLILYQLVNEDYKIEYSEEILWSLLCHLGYLTLDPNLKSQLDDQNNDNNSSMLYDYQHCIGSLSYLRIPNKEIFRLFCDEIDTRFSRFNQYYRNETQEVFKLLIAKPSSENSIIFSDYLSMLLNQFISIRDGSDRTYKSNPEWYYHAFLNGYISAYSALNKIKLASFNSNKELGNGYADLAFITKDHPKVGVIIEIKVTQDFQQLENKANEAIAQIKDKKYITGFLSEIRVFQVQTVHIYGISFCKKDCFIKAELINPNDYSN